MSKNIYSVTTQRKPAKPRSADRQATASGGGGATAAAYEPTTTAPSKVASADHATTADSAKQAEHATSADSATYAARAGQADHAAAADKANKANTADYATAANIAETAKTLQTDNYNKGLQGGRIDSDGNAELESLRVRGSLSVIELLINRISAIEGDTVLTESGVIERVEGSGTYRLYLRSRWDGDRHAFAVGDVLRGVYNNMAAAAIGVATSGVGVVTSWLRVTAVGSNYIDASTYRASLTPEGTNTAPVVGMRLARWGNDRDKARQSSIYLSATQGAIYQLQGVTKPKLERANYATTWGKLPDFIRDLLGGAVAVDDSYLYARGIVVEDLLRLTKDGALAPFEGKAGKDGMTTMPNLLRGANLPGNLGAWTLNDNTHGLSKHEPTVVPPVTGAQVWSLYSGMTDGLYAELMQEVNVVEGKSYTLSVYIKGATSGWLIAWPISGVHFAMTDAKPLTSTNNNASEWTRYTVTFVAQSTGKTNIYLRSWYRNGRRGTVYFAAPKLEEGTQATPWALSPQDYRGAAVRNLGEWDALPSGFALESGRPGERFVDLVCTTEPGGAMWWQCKQSHAKDGNRPSKSNPKWELGVSLSMLATKILLAEAAIVDNLTVRSIISRDASGKIVLSATDSGDIYIGGKATIAGFVCSVPVVITPDNYTQYLSSRDGNDLYFSPFDIGSSFVFMGDFRGRVGYNTQLYISNLIPKIPGIAQGLVHVGTAEFGKDMAARMSYLGTSVYIANFVHGVSVQVTNRSDLDLGYAGFARLDYQLPDTTNGTISIWRPTIIKPQ